MDPSQVRVGQILKHRDGRSYLVVHAERGGPHKIKSAKTGMVFAQEQYNFEPFDVESEPLGLFEVKKGQKLVDFGGEHYEVVGFEDSKYDKVGMNVLARDSDGRLHSLTPNQLGSFRIVQPSTPAPESQPEPKAPTVTIELEETLADSRLLIIVKPEIINSVVSRELSSLTFAGNTTLDDIAAEAIERDLAVLLDVEGVLKAHREDEDITQDTVARRCGVPVALISMIENGALTKLVSYLQERK